MPRANRRARDSEPEDLSHLAHLSTRTETFRGQEFAVRGVRGAGAGRTYVCPGCQQPLSDTVPHVVVWPLSPLTGVTNRRHWHTPCWSARDRRGAGGSWQ